jgi:hypothetical protein
MPEGSTSTTIEGMTIQPSGQIDSARSKGRGSAPGFVEWQRDHDRGGS